MASQDDFDTDVMIAYPVNFAEIDGIDVEKEDPDEFDYHVTTVYMGESSDLEALGIGPQDLLKVIEETEFNDLGVVDVEGLTLFGEDSDVLVVLLNSSSLEDNHTRLVDNLSKIGYNYISDFDKYRPHITLKYDYYGPTEGFGLPTSIAVQPPQLWWNGEVVTS